MLHVPPKIMTQSVAELLEEFAAIVEAFDAGAGTAGALELYAKLTAKLTGPMIAYRTEFLAARQQERVKRSFLDAEGKQLMLARFEHDIDVAMENQKEGWVARFEVCKGDIERVERAVDVLKTICAHGAVTELSDAAKAADKIAPKKPAMPPANMNPVFKPDPPLDVPATEQEMHDIMNPPDPAPPVKPAPMVAAHTPPSSTPIDNTDAPPPAPEAPKKRAGRPKKIKVDVGGDVIPAPNLRPAEDPGEALTETIEPPAPVPAAPGQESSFQKILNMGKSA